MSQPMTKSPMCTCGHVESSHRSGGYTLRNRRGYGAYRDLNPKGRCGRPGCEYRYFSRDCKVARPMPLI